MEWNRGRVIAWLVVIGVALAGVPFVPVLMSIGWIAAMVYGVVTAVWMRKYGPEVAALRHPLPYRLLLGAMLAVAAAGIVTGASVVFTDPETGREHLEACGISGLFVIVLVLAWRALVAPSPRRASLLGAVALCGVVPAVMIDALTSVGVRQHVPITATTQGFVCVVALFIDALLGAFACLAALAAFRPGEPTLPEARVED